MPLVKVRDFKPSMRVDLEGDKFANPDNSKTLLANEYQVVDEVD
jgi:hypothetical protein